MTLPKPGQRIELLHMPDDPAPIASGSRGTVLSVQQVIGEDHIHVAWDNGSSLNLISSVDSWRSLSQEEV